jgi:hypothetical protein
MKFFNLLSVRKKSFWGIMLFALAFQACEDHRLPPAAEELPDQVFYALTDNNVIYELNVRNTSTPIRTINISEGLEANDVLLGIDFRPATGQLYAVSKNARLYHINLSTAVKPGLATVIGAAAFDSPVSATAIGFDFNPTVDRIRYITNTTQNLRLNPETGGVAGTDGVINGATTTIGASAYTNSFSGTASTQLYNIDAATDQLYLQTPPNNGTQVLVGPLGLDITEVGGFDITPSKTTGGKEYAIASVLFGGAWELDFVDLATGKLQKLGQLPSGRIIGIAIPTPVAYAVTTDNNLVIFNPLAPSTSVQKAISMPSGVSVEGIDFRPFNATLYAVGSDSKLYTINTLNGAATLATSLKDATTLMDKKLEGDSFGVDFNPFADRLRIVSNTGQNLRINVTDGAVTSDGTLNIITPATSPKGVNGAAYTNSITGLTAGSQTVLYDIDSETGKLFKQDPPNAGGLVEVGSLGFAIDKANGFDIGNVSSKGYALFTVGGVVGLYSVNISTGAATYLGTVGGTPLTGIKGFALGFNL